ncbi:unnamed protein product [Phaedon cochleariae]|uniref:Uncharacterized protein n=1 Tax=Phaedon cochleariae TaxID=80249 RepID=A0A9N9SJI3_PHACE|nr:unnamed protein product [Phaedon cochleariae]
MSESEKRKKLSGYQYRKERLEKQERLKSLTSDISNFFRPRSSRDGEGSSSQSQPDPTSEDADITIAVEDGDRANVSVQENSVEAEDYHDDCAIDLKKIYDLAKWPNIISDNLKILIVKKGPCQVRNVIFPKDNHGRAFSENYYIKRLHNESQVRRRKKKRQFDYEGDDESISSPENSFKVNFFCSTRHCVKCFSGEV